MTKVKAFWAWLKQNWKIPVIIVGIILGWLLFRSRREKGTPLAQTKVELQALEAAGQARAKEAELGAAQARAWVEVCRNPDTTPDLDYTRGQVMAGAKWEWGG